MMDGKHFIECTFTACILGYSGEPVIVESSSFTSCSFRFHGEAARTVRFLECFSMLPEEERPREPFSKGLQFLSPALNVM
jgi:hypothetical protein